MRADQDSPKFIALRERSNSLVK